MQAVQFHRYGPPDVLEVADVPLPQPGPTQVLIRVSHSGVNFAEVMFRRGQIPVGLPHLPGLEAVGTVAQFGAKVTGLAEGDRVAALTLAGGGQAEYVVAEATHTVPLTGALAAVDSPSAAAALCNGTTAVGAVSLCGRPVAGERVLVTAAAGGVGQSLVQLLANTGVSVVASTSDPAKLNQATRSAVAECLTYDEVIDAQPFDVVFDSVGGAPRKTIRDKLTLFGRHVIMGDAAQQDVQIYCDAVWFSGTAINGYNLGALAHGRPDLFAAHMREALGHVATGRLTANATVIAPEEIRDVHSRLEARITSGKFVIEW